MNELYRRLCDPNALARAVDVDKQTVRFLAQSTALASDQLIIVPNAGQRWNKEFMKNPIFVPAHMRYPADGSPVVVGSVQDTEFAKDGMYQTVKFADTQRGQEYWSLYRDGHMRAVSIAWSRDDKREVEPVKMGQLLQTHGIRLSGEEFKSLRGVVTEFRQRDLSAVAIGADPKALAHAADGGNESARSLLDSYTRSADGNLYVPVEDEVRGVCPFHSYDLAPAGAAWDAAAEARDATPEDLMKMCTWFDSANKGAKGAYKLPHHALKGYKTNWRGVAAAMAALLGARGGLKGISAEDRRGIYNHLVKHYKEFDKEPPEFRSDYDSAELLRMELDFIVEDTVAVMSARLDGIAADIDDIKRRLTGQAETEENEEEHTDGGDAEAIQPLNFYADLLSFDPATKRGGEAIPEDLLSLAESVLTTNQE